LGETAHAAEFFLADGLIVTGSATGDAAKPSDFEGCSEKTHQELDSSLLEFKWNYF